MSFELMSLLAYVAGDEKAGMIEECKLYGDRAMELVREMENTFNSYSVTILAWDEMEAIPALSAYVATDDELWTSLEYTLSTSLHSLCHAFEAASLPGDMDKRLYLKFLERICCAATGHILTMAEGIAKYAVEKGLRNQYCMHESAAEVASLVLQGACSDIDDEQKKYVSTSIETAMALMDGVSGLPREWRDRAKCALKAKAIVEPFPEREDAQAIFRKIREDFSPQKIAHDVAWHHALVYGLSGAYPQEELIDIPVFSKQSVAYK